MRKTWLIIRREYLTRVRNKTFILSTFLTPLLFAGILGIVIFITIKNSDKERIAIVDSTGIFANKPDTSSGVVFVADASADTSDFDKKGYSAILYSPETGANKGKNWKVYARKNFGLMSSDEVNRKLRKELENDLLLKHGVDIQLVDSIRNAAQQTDAETTILEAGSGAKQGNSGIAYGIGYACAFLIYITLFIYGAMVMRGVMEEKTNRIAELMVSSVKPFQLMMGKIIGIGAVGLTQFLMWAILLVIFSAVINAFIPADVMAQVTSSGAQLPGNNAQASEAIMNLAKAQHELSSVNWLLIISCFIFYFLFGYLFYAALFAAVGSAVNEDPQDAQSLMLPVTMPIFLAIIIMVNAIVHPEGSLATWGSMIPFFSPVVMMARIPFGVPGAVPWWQLGLSMAILVAGFLLTTWLSAKIYRTGILMYGKKATWKEMWKWTFRKN
ncbi:MAG: ABC transporter permease [Flavitalea sp.]